MDEQQSSEISIETLNPFRVASYRVVNAAPEDDCIAYMKAWIPRQKMNGPLRTFGFNVYVALEQQKAGYRGYEVWIPVPADIQPSDGVSMKDYEGGLYAVMTLDKPLADGMISIPTGWKKLHEWVIGSDEYRSGSHQWLEEVIVTEDGDDLKLYHPIMPVMASV